MADIQGKHSVSRAQGRRQRAHASTKPAVKTSKASKPNKLSKSNTPGLPEPIITRRGQTTTRRYPGRSFHRFEEAKGKALDYIEFFTAGEYHSIDICFADKTGMNLVIEPSFTLKTEYASRKGDEWRTIKRWPPIRSASFSS
jgi:hypothetical protein